MGPWGAMGPWGPRSLGRGAHRPRTINMRVHTGLKTILLKGRLARAFFPTFFFNFYKFYNLAINRLNTS